MHFEHIGKLAEDGQTIEVDAQRCIITGWEIEPGDAEVRIGTTLYFCRVKAGLLTAPLQRTIEQAVLAHLAKASARRKGE